MNESTILLAPAPGAKSDFLATVSPLTVNHPLQTQTKTNNDDDEEYMLPFEITLDGYSREPWAIQKQSPTNNNNNKTSHAWESMFLQSVDGRGKLPGFLKYLKDRKKAAVGRFDSDFGTRAIFVVPPDQPDISSSSSFQSVSSKDVLYCRFMLDISKLEKKKTTPSHSKQRMPSAPSLSTVSKTVPASQPIMKQTKIRKSTKTKNTNSLKSGFLGNLLGATKKTEEHLAAVPKSSVRKQDGNGTNAFGGSGMNSSSASGVTSGSIIAKFREDMEQKLMDFLQNSSCHVIKIPISIAEITRDLPQDQKPNITMDILKYIVYEQAEEIGDDKWVAAKEASGFMDEAIVAVYKEGHAPSDVLEDLMKGDLPDEIRGQQRAIVEASRKNMVKKEGKQDLLREQDAMKKNVLSSGMTELNTNKRDRRTIAEIQRDMISGNNDDNNKRARTEF